MVLTLDDAEKHIKTAKRAHCPKCKNELTSRVPRGVLAKTLFFWLPLKRYACKRCKTRYYTMS